MQFIYHPSPTHNLILTGEEHKYLFKVRRTKKNELVKVRNLKDDYLYIYKIEEINKKEAILTLKEKILSPNRPKKFIHLAWCIIDPKNIEKALPMLNEIGVGKISFIYCEFSQKNFRLKPKRLDKILINSSQQCGRGDIIEIEFFDSIEEFVKEYKEFVALDFGGKGEITKCNKPFLIGPEGGFSDKERKLFKEIVSLDTFILRSETAAVALSSKLI
jgi:16S rRNA (uracil1498-N3)-methyltransferase